MKELYSKEAKQMFTEKLKNGLKPLYANLLKSVENFKQELAPFCIQWGKNFPTSEHEGILFVGRATNGFVTDSRDIEELFGDSEDKIFDRDNQMQWISDYWDEPNPESDYKCNRSAFWRTIRAVSEYFHKDNWQTHVAWTNLCKVAPWEGKKNPNNGLYYAQLEDCKKILETEIKILSPKVVVLLTGENWANDFLRHFNGDKERKSIRKKSWDGYQCKLYEIAGTYFILSEHPQGKQEASHQKCLIKMIESL